MINHAFSVIRLLNTAKTYAAKLVCTPTANRVITFQDGNGTVAFTSDIPSLPLTVSNGGTGTTTATGSGSVVLSSSPNVTNPTITNGNLTNVSVANAAFTNSILGTPASGNLTNCNGNATGLTAGKVGSLNLSSGETNVTGILNTTLGGTNANVTGLVLSLQTVRNITDAYSSGTEVIPNDNTIPQITEGKLFLTQTITPKTVNSTLIIEVLSQISCNLGGTLIVTGAVFSNVTGSNAISSAQMTIPSANASAQMVIRDIFTPNTTNPINITFRMGQASGYRVSQNGYAGGGLMGGSKKSSLIITETIDT